MSSTSGSSSSSLSQFDPREHFNDWMASTAPTNDWITEIKKRYEALGSDDQLAFAFTVFEQVGYDFDKLNSDAHRAALRHLASRVVDKTDVMRVESSTDKLAPSEPSYITGAFELDQIILSYLGFKELAKCAVVNKTWRQMANTISKQLAYDKSFSNVEWKRCFG